MDQDEIRASKLKKCLNEPGYFYNIFVDELKRIGVSERRLKELVDLTANTLATYKGIAEDYNRSDNKEWDLPSGKKLGELVAATAYSQYGDDLREILARTWLICTAETACKAARFSAQTTLAMTTIFMTTPRSVIENALQTYRIP